jgi:hypothetical protein
MYTKNKKIEKGAKKRKSRKYKYVLQKGGLFKHIIRLFRKSREKDIRKSGEKDIRESGEKDIRESGEKDIRESGEKYIRNIEFLYLLDKTLKKETEILIFKSLSSLFDNNFDFVYNMKDEYYLYGMKFKHNDIKKLQNLCRKKIFYSRTINIPILKDNIFYDALKEFGYIKTDLTLKEIKDYDEDEDEKPIIIDYMLKHSEKINLEIVLLNAYQICDVEKELKHCHYKEVIEFFMEYLPDIFKTLENRMKQNNILNESITTFNKSLIDSPLTSSPVSPFLHLKPRPFPSRKERKET